MYMTTASELRSIAKEMGIRGYSKMNKSALTAAIEGSVPDKVEVSSDDVGGHSVPKVEKPKRAPSKWVRFCQEHSKAEGITYKQAMSRKDEYELWKTDKLEAVHKEEQLQSVEETCTEE
tara:strand:- start:32 stop:388 length:357 start_codon:yes stop_codon:yes gene_type:complete